MRLQFEPFDGRGRHWIEIIDQDSGENVGLIQSYGVGFAGFGGINVNLFDGKYTASLKRYDECVGFVRGVEAVLNHMLPAKRIPAQKAKRKRRRIDANQLAASPLAVERLHQ